MFVFLRKNYPLILTSLFFFVYGIAFRMVYCGENSNFDSNNLILCMSLLVILGVLIYWVYFMIHAAKNKDLKHNILWVFLIYFFNVFIIPYYYFKYVLKNDNIETKMIFMVIMIVISFYFGILITNLGI